MSAETPAVPATETPAAPKTEKPKEAAKVAVPARREDKVHVWPYLTRMELLSAILATIVLTVWSIAIDAPLEEPANPARTPNPSKAPWYFLGLQELLVYFDPWIAGVVLPTLIIVGLMCIPYIDPNPKGNGYYTFKERWFAITTFNFGFIVLWVFLIIIGVFFRGPGWNLFLPWERWDAHKVVPLNNIDLNEFVALIPTWFGGGPITLLLNPDGKNNIPPAILGLLVVGGFFGIGMHFFGHFVCWLEGAVLRKPIVLLVTGATVMVTAVLALKVSGAAVLVGLVALVVELVWAKKQLAEGDAKGRPTPASFYKLMGPMRYYTTAFLFVSMMGVVVKALARHLLTIKYVLVLPWINANV